MSVMQGGFMCLESGLRRAKNSINVAIKSLTDFGRAVLDGRYGLMFGDSGAGLGLAICRSIVDGLSGRIWVESTPGQGSSFFVAWPAAAYEEAKPADEARQAGKPRPD